MELIDRLLKEVKTHIKIRDLKREFSEEDFNMFRICGVNHYENTHSNIIAEILNPRGSHNHGDEFLGAFIAHLKDLEILESDFQFSAKGSQVFREYHAMRNGRIDIVIVNNGKAIAIENKIYSKEGPGQLDRYWEFGKQKFGENNFKLLYLTLWEDEEEEKEGSDDEVYDNKTYFPISHSSNIVNWLEECIKISAKSPVVRETLIQYQNHIKGLTNQNINRTMEKELIEKLSKKENIDAAFTVANNIGKVKTHLINSILLGQLSKISEGKEWAYIIPKEKGTFLGTYATFQFEVENWRDYKIFV